MESQSTQEVEDEEMQDNRAKSKVGKRPGQENQLILHSE